ncbi:MAG: translocation protein TolB [Schlesneria sp.]|nr:translocation protein TolB [Schlesneria sp.]
MAAFSTNGEVLTYRDFQATPFGNHITDWYAPLVDKNQDAKISWEEFYDNTAPHAILLYREYFNRFDRDHDGFLSFDEYELSVDLDKITPEIAFRVQDKDYDNSLAFGEVFTDQKPTTKDPAEIERYEMRLAAAETRFLADDLDHSRSLNLDEFRRSKEAALKAVERKTKALTRHRRSQPSNLPFIAFVIADVLVLSGAAWYAFKRFAKNT